MKFNETKLDNNIIRAVEDIGFEEMTSIQEKALEPILAHKDLVAMSNTGSGKTAAFMLPLLQHIDVEEKNTQILVISPTRELAIQIVQETRKFLKYMHNINALAIYGGQEIRMQAISLRKGVKIVVGTPGRILDLLKKKTFKIANLKAIVLDEADECLNMGFEKEINAILGYVPHKAQKLMFSATLSEDIKRITNLHIKNAEYIECKQNETLLVNNIKQYAIELKEKIKNEITLRILRNENAKNSIVFCNTKKKTEEVFKFLKSANIKVEMLNSDIRQEEREKALKKLKNGALDTIVVTDVLARGIDVKDLELVINYDIPFEKEYYVHRIGRTARGNNSGVAYTFYTGKQIEKLREIEEYTGSKFEYIDIPKPKQEENTTVQGYTLKENGFYDVTFDLGKNDSIKAKDIVGALSALVGLKQDKIGKIEVFDDRSVVEIPEEYIAQVDKVFSNGKIKTIDVHIIK